MHYKFIATLLFIFSFSAAQTNDSLMLAHPELTASGYALYPAPEKSVKYTKPPQGYKPFYISHYGRHGSRYHYSASDYTYLYETLSKADSAKALTMTGKYVMSAAKALADSCANRAGDLTQIGILQHQGIAERMAKNFSDVFKSSGKKRVPMVNAYASTSGRCILSMSAFLGELRAQKPKVSIHQETGKSIMAFLNNFNFDITKNYAETEEFKKESNKLWQKISTQNFVQTLFADTAYAVKNIDISSLYNKMFEISGSLQGIENSEPFIIFERLFSKEEKLSRWKAQNAWWYSILGTCPLTGNDGLNTAKPILKHILDESEKAVEENSGIAATLRFGHDTGILPLAGLMQLSIANARVENLENLHLQWTDFKIIPMAANLQIVFYKSSSKNKPILVKMLYNEREVTAPIPCKIQTDNDLNSAANKNSKCPTAPFYRWEDFKDFYKSLL